MIVIDGKKIAAEILEPLKYQPKPEKKLVAVLVGDDSSSISFLKQKEKMAKELGIEFKLYTFTGDVDQEDLEEKIEEIGKDERVGGIIIQLPLPPRFNRERIIARINPKKDIDAITPNVLVESLPVAVLKAILSSVGYDINDKVVAVVGRGILIGKPVAEWIKGKCREVLVFSSASNLADLKIADLVITGVGKAGLIKPEMLKSGVGVIDFGFDTKDGKISGDLDIKSLVTSHSSLSFYTPTPGGTGPILVAELFRNFYLLNK